MYNKIYLEKTSMLHGLDFWVKFTVFLLLLPLATFIVPSYGVLIIIIYLMVLVVISKIHIRIIWKQSRFYILPLSVFVIILSIAFSSGSFSSRVLIGLDFAIRFSILIVFGTIFSIITDPIELPIGLIRARIPQKYGIILMTAYRMFPLISNKVSQIYNSQKSRGVVFSISINKISKIFPQIMSLIIPIVISTLEISVSLSDTLISRGYNPYTKITIPPTNFHSMDFIIFISSFFILCVSVII